ncbi:MAG: hypothetical protein AAGD12_10385, partial [Pseudomonadota bacterium]
MRAAFFWTATLIENVSDSANRSRDSSRRHASALITSEHRPERGQFDLAVKAKAISEDKSGGLLNW